MSDSCELPDLDVRLEPAEAAVRRVTLDLRPWGDVKLVHVVGQEHVEAIVARVAHQDDRAEPAAEVLAGAQFGAVHSAGLWIDPEDAGRDHVASFGRADQRRAHAFLVGY